MKSELRISIILLLIFLSSNNSAQDSYPSLFSLTKNNYNFDKAKFSNYSINNPLSIPPENHSFINLGGQFLVGSTLSFAFFIPSVVIGWASAWNRSTDLEEAAVGILMISSYLFGATVGVHWIAKVENSNLSFWGTAAYSAIGGGASALLIAIASTKYTRIPSVVIIIAASLPVIGAMFYSSFISDWSDQRSEESSIQKDLTHFDLIERTKLFNINLLHIRL
ncbi:MAG: hypothetical protein HND52_00210 [Ignavibacteriae bacterium]|nr:hypothetical protein [Ignavibacteriota bacterium]NOG96369.1 hypothetical protein [Ignavibacteriota bacterium]